MQCTQITIKGGDSAHRQRMLKTSSCVWLFPDGIERVITMSGWHWSALDHFISIGKADLPQIAKNVFELATQEVDLDPSLSFEQELHATARELVRMSWYDAQNKMAANNNGVLDYHKQTS